MAQPGRHADGANLFLVVDKSGAKRWVFFWMRQGRQREMGLGSLNGVTLAQARQKAADCSALLAQGLDPIEARKTGAELRKNQRTFADCASKLIASKRSAWRSQKHYEQWVTSLDRPCALIRDRYVADIDTAAVLQVLQPLWSKTPETALRIRGRIEAVLDYAKAQGWRTGENCARWKGHLEAILPKRQKLARGHHAAMSYPDLPAFIQLLRKKIRVARAVILHPAYILERGQL